MEKNLYSRLISIGAILIALMYPLVKIAKSRNDIYTNNILKELFIIYPFISGISVIIVFILLSALFIIIDLRSIEKYNTNEYERIKEKILHCINMLVIIYLISLTCAILIYSIIENQDTYKDTIIGKVLICIISLELLIVLFFAIKKLLKVKNNLYIKIWNWKKKHLKLSVYEYLVLILLYSISLFISLVIVFSYNGTKYFIEFSGHENGEVFISIEANKEITSFTLNVNDNPIKYNRLTGEVNEVRKNNEEIKMLNNEFYYRFYGTIIGCNNNTNNKISVDIKFKSEFELNNEVYFENEFIGNHNNYIYANPIMTFSQ